MNVPLFTNGAPAGISFRANVIVPEGFSEGQWHYSQMWKRARSRTPLAGAAQVQPNNGLWGLDNSVPYSAAEGDEYTGEGWNTGSGQHEAFDLRS
jgi:hypothetical protein